MSSEVAIRVRSVSKSFRSYAYPGRRLRQMACNALARISFGAVRENLLSRARKQSSEFWALRDVSFEVARGQTVGVIGRNGSGKSTLLQIVCGTLAPTSGSVEVVGRVAALLELGSGFNPDYTGRENIYFNAQLLGLTRQQVDQRFDAIAAFADIGAFLDEPVKTYSSGMFVRLAFAVIAHVDADILVIDEALAVGDAFFTQKCMRFLRSFMRTGTVLFVSHDTASIKSLCNRAIWLEAGQLLRDGPPKEVSDLYMQAFYETRQGTSTHTALRPQFAIDRARPTKDQRLSVIHHSNLRNDLRVVAFDPHAPSFGDGGATICDVVFTDESDDPLSWVVGGEEVQLRIVVRADRELQAPIIGFFVKDKLGQFLFGDNTYLAQLDDPVPCPAGQFLVGNFRFRMPILKRGEYSLSAAIAEGTQEEHQQLQWIHDALVFRSEASTVSTGLIGIPMSAVSLAVLEMDEVTSLQRSQTA